LPITVAALMTPEWIADRIQVPAAATRVLLPGYCHGDLNGVQRRTVATVERGPRDLLQLPDYLGTGSSSRPEVGDYDIQIIAEINHAPRLTRPQVLEQAQRLAADGADVIDIGCDPGGTWKGVGPCVRELRERGLRVSIDSFQPGEIDAATRAGAELVLSVNASNRQAAADWGCEVVVIPDEVSTLAGLEDTIELLDKQNVPMRLDPILEPIGLGFAASLQRYSAVRARYPELEMMMGVGNLTELTDVDSAGVNVVLLAICQELGIRSVLTTQVINWSRTSVRECDRARRLVHFAQKHRVPPKNLSSDLVMLRDAKIYPLGRQRLEELAQRIKDNNYRLFAEDAQLHLMCGGLHLRHADPFQLFEHLLAEKPRNMNASHAFYLGYELCKAVTALALDKQYCQDEALDWGMLTVPERSHRARRRMKDEG
jgi:dihydropteroate synthase-like protein